MRLLQIGGILVLVSIVINQQVAGATKIDCFPIDGATKEKCESLGCIWSPVNNNEKDNVISTSVLSFDRELTEKLMPGNYPPEVKIDEPWCYHPDDYQGYKVVDSSDLMDIKLQRVKPSALQTDIKNLRVTYETFGNVARLRVFDADNKRYEPDIPELNLAKVSDDDFQYVVHDGGHIQVIRKSTGAVLFDTDLRKLTFAEKFIQLNTKLDSEFVFGLGEHYDTFVKTTDAYKPYSFYHTDRLPVAGGQRSYGSFPYYISLDSNKKHAHGVYLRNSNAMDVVIQKDQSITFRPIGGILDFLILSGPTPNEVTKQFQNLVGLPSLPPRWSLGFHLCRYDYKSLDKVKQVWQRTKDSGIPFEAQWTDIDYMDRHNDFTYDKNKFNGLPEFVDELHEQGMHYVLLFDPGLSQEDNYYPYELGQQMDIWVKNATNQTLVGKVWNDSGRTVFPDFSNPKSTDYWSKLFKIFHDELKYDGAWIDMNDISNFVEGSIDGCPQDDPNEQTPYKPGNNELQFHSLCLSAKHRAGIEFDVHNLYSFYEAIATYKALEVARPGKRPLIISRSSTPGQGHYGGHWSGDVLSSWDYLRWSIPSLLEHSMYGYSLMGSDVCGFNGNTNEQLCARWSTLGAFYTFTRNHNDDVSIDQDPVALGQTVVEANKNALSKKYELLPYIYSLIHRAHRFGETPVRSLAFEFFDRSDLDNILKVEYQFMWGSGIMIAPVVYENTYDLNTYLPQGRWYRSSIVPNSPEADVPKWFDSKGESFYTPNISLTDLVLFYRGGVIVPIYPTIKQTIGELVKQPIGLDVPLCNHDMASGEIYLDSGDNVDGKYTHLKTEFRDNKLTVEMDHDEAIQTVDLGQVRIIGIYENVTSVLLNGLPINFVRSDHVVRFDLGGFKTNIETKAIIQLVV